MKRLEPNECRVLGVLVEKAMTTPAQYPLTLNALVNGCNQKNNRDPVLNLDEEAVFDAVDSLKQKGYVREVHLTGSRVEKYRHVAKEVLEIDTTALVILTELLLRGPQTVGELRGRATRMHPLESMEVVEASLSNLMNRQEPLVQEVAPAPGSRARRYAQLLCPDLHAVDACSMAPVGGAAERGGSGELAARVAALEEQVASLRDAVARIHAALGSPEERSDHLGG